jgi:hypothetical protein
MQGLRKPGACLSVSHVLSLSRISRIRAESGRRGLQDSIERPCRVPRYEGKERQDQGPGSRAIAGREPPHRFSSFSFPSMFQPVEHSSVLCLLHKVWGSFRGGSMGVGWGIINMASGV